jgi:P4 family phage/plasmid primase-like protien
MSAIKVHQGIATSPSPISLDANEVDNYLAKHKDLYEITFHNGEINRAFVDLDGKIFNCSEDDFETTDETIKQLLSNIDFGTPYSVMTSSKYQNQDWKDKSTSNKLSYRLTFLNKCGSKNAVQRWTQEFVAPKIKEAFEYYDAGLPFYIVGVDKKKGDEHKTDYLEYDNSVYRTNGKMRCWNSSKPNENRFNVISSDHQVVDTCITFVPPNCEKLPEPFVETKTKQSETTTTTQQEETEVKQKETSVLEKVVDNLGQQRWENYQDFITIGMACFNEDLPLSVWERNAKKGSKNKPNDCADHWKGFKKSNLTQATLWAMLKQDNETIFKQLNQDRNDFKTLVSEPPTHFKVAQFFFNCKVNDYLYDNATGWWGIKNNNLWEATNSKTCPPSIKTKIVRVMTENRIILEKTISKQKQKLLEKENYDKEQLDKLDKYTNCIFEFKRNIESDSFLKGVISFLQSLYDENSKIVLDENNASDLSEIMDSNPNLFAFSDCCYDFTINDFRSIRPTDYISITCGYKKPTSNPSTRQLLVQTLKTIWEDDSVYQYVLDVLSSCMCGVRNMEAFFIATGKGRNGKGLIFELICNVLGSYFYALPEYVLCKRIDNPSAPSPDIAKLRGKRLAMATEPEENENLMEGTIKKMTGGDKLTGRALYGNPITYKPQFALFLQANNIPNFNSLSPAIIKRLVVIPFPFIFVDKPTPNTNERQGNPDIKNVYCRSDDWRDEMCLILLENYNRIRGKAIDALDTPSVVKNATSEYTDENNAVGSWWKENYEPSTDGFIRSRDALDDYFRDTKNKMDSKAFKSALAFNNIEIKKNTKGLMGIKGWKRKQIEEETENETN